ncbi:hypothetical protein AB0A69_00905 [Streptomyces sp. NPDC045431]|uniref:hypothetical protein n=1 Tax=Streptomyces sp. NPDC045431 TaxID=3155613 RepID=UPI0033CCD770
MSPASSPGRRITQKLSGDALAAATGKDWDGWFALLDAWGAATGRSHTEIARHLVEAYGVPGWHAQSITVGYEQERGLRQVGQSSAGDWQVSVSKTVSVPPEQVSEAFADPELRRRWLPDVPEGDFALRMHRPGRSLTADWGGATSRVAVRLTPKGEGGTQIGLGHTKLPDADAVAAYRSFWRERLAELKRLLES